MRRTAFKSGSSKAKRDFDAEYAAVLPSVLARGCEFVACMSASDMQPDGLVPYQCQGRLVGHHARGRKTRHANDPLNLRCLCDAHHVYVHAHSRWAREVGLMLSRIS